MDVLNFLWILISDLFYNWDNVLVFLVLIFLIPLFIRFLAFIAELYVIFLGHIFMEDEDEDEED